MNNDLYRQCAACRVCDGAAYQSVPMLGHGFKNDAPVIGVGQNPGIFKPDDGDHVWWANHVNDEAPAGLIEHFAAWSFERSRAATELGKVFGETWLADGIIYWTNAVRCRTEDNKTPSDLMVASCKLWTNRLLQSRKAVVVVGSVARAQLFGEEAAKLEWGKLRQNKRMGMYVLAIRHYAAWGRPGMSMSASDEVALYRESWERLIDKLRQDGVLSLGANKLTGTNPPS